MPPKDLTRPQIAALGQGNHRIAQNLYLRVQGPGSRIYSFRYTQAGKQRWKAIGPAQHVSLEEAKAKARDMTSALYNHGKLTAPRSKVITFAEAARQVLENRRTGVTKATARDWATSLLTFAAPLSAIPVHEIEVQNIRDLLLPIWLSMPDKADKIQTRLKIVLDWCSGQGCRTGNNPAARDIIKPQMPQRPPRGEREHRVSVPLRLMPRIYAELERRTDPASFCLRLQLLCALRPKEAVAAKWEEFDLEAGLWTIPFGTMKNRHELVVPLSNAAIRLLTRMKPEAARRLGPKGLVFEFRNRMNKLRLTLRKVCAVALNGIDLTPEEIREVEKGVTAHGSSRSCFQDFCSAAGMRGARWHLVQACLAHKRPTLDRAYSRETWLEERREIMQQWAQYLLGAPPQKQIDAFLKAVRGEAQ